jgi:arylformamidase
MAASRRQFAFQARQALRSIYGGEMKKIFDITVAISSETPIYKGDPGVEITSFKAIAAGSTANVSQISLGVHTATHVDAPNHFIDGAKRVHELDPNKLVGPCRVIQIADDITGIEPEHVGDIAGVERVLFKTRNSNFWATPEDGFRTDFTYLTPPTATLLVDNGIVLVGIDYLSIEKSGSPGHPVHITLLENEVVILEGIDLREVPPGDYELICMPLKYDGATGDGSPARTMLREL